MSVLTFDEWCDTYDPQENLDRDGLCLYETYGVDMLLVRNAEENRVWTLIDADGDEYIVNGRHYVNRIGYYLTDTVWSGDEDIVVDLSKEGK